jgi:hypothetical protein
VSFSLVPADGWLHGPSSVYREINRRPFAYVDIDFCRKIKRLPRRTGRNQPYLLIVT